jgi:multicomponent Na+:H+ antiporter subunit G
MTLPGIVGYILMFTGVVLIGIGIIGFYKFKDFYVRALIASLIDTAGFICVSIGLLFHHQISYFTLKIGIIIVLMLLLNPLATHIITRSAHLSHHKNDKEGDNA